MGESRFPEPSVENGISSISSGDAFATPPNHMRRRAGSFLSPRRKLSTTQTVRKRSSWTDSRLAFSGSEKPPWIREHGRNAKCQGFL